MKKVIKYCLLGLGLFLIHQTCTMASSLFRLEEDPNTLTYKIERTDKTVRLYFLLVKDKETGELVYCLEPGVALNEQEYKELSEWDYQKANLSEEQKNYITKVAYYGYHYPGHEHIYYYYAAQLLIWESIIPNNWQIYYTDQLGGNRVEWFIKERNEILDLIAKDETLPSFASQKFTWNAKETLNIVDHNGKLSEYHVTKKENSMVTQKENSLQIKKETPNKEVIEFTKDYQGNPIKFYVREDGQNIMRTGKLPSKTFQITVEPYSPKIIINKVDEENHPLEGVTFALYAKEEIKDATGKIIYHKNTLIETKKTGPNGSLTFSNLYDGNYKVKETETLSGYEQNIEEYFVLLNKQNDMKTFHIENKRKRETLILLKQDEETKKPLSGIRFQVKDETGKIVFDGKTDKNGQITIDNLLLGTYSIIEVETNQDYEILKTPITTVLDGSNNTKTVIIKNKKKRETLVILKQDEETKKPLSGIRFQVKDETGKIVFDGKTDKNGQMTIDNLLLGTYSIIEVETINHYEILKNPIKITLEGQEIVKKIIVFNKQMRQSLQIIKQDKDSTILLKGVHFQIWNEQEECIYDGYTNEEGKIELHHLPLGTYKLVEVETILGYELEKKPIYFELDGTKEMLSITITNQKIIDVPNTMEMESLKTTPIYINERKRKYEKTHF